jgi:hypothetical protein
MPEIAATWEAKIELWFEAILINKPGTVRHIYDPSYLGGIARGTAV